MDTYRTRRRWSAALGAVGLLAHTACGGDAARNAGAVPAPAGDTAGAFEEVVTAVGRAKIAICDAVEGGPYVPLPAPPKEAAAAAAYFRYLEGRIYSFAPCEVPSNQRNELRMFRYGDPGTRDEAIREMAGRHTRPTSAFALGDTYEAQIRSPDPSLEGPVGRAAAAVHVAISRVGRARHLDVGPSAACAPRAPADPVVLDIAGFAFCPATVTVPVGVELVWTNADLAPHTVTFAGPDGTVDSGSMAQGQSWSTRFGQAGTYRYYCRFHPGMEGTIVVEGAR